MSARFGLALAVTLAVSSAAGAAAAETPVVRIVSPPSGQPVFGQVVFAVEVSAAETVARVELFVDERRKATLASPPYRAEVDTGYDNVEHRFRAVVTTVSGESGVAAVTTPRIEVDDEVDVALQQLYVTATHRDARVLDLDRDDFEIFDDGERQRLVTFERGDVPFTAVILLDASASMAGAKLRAALGGAGAFSEGMRPLDEARLMVFSDSLLASTPFAGPGPEMAAGAAGVVARGGTALNDNLFVALEELERRQGRRVVVILSDGMDSHSVLTMDDVFATAERSRAIVYWVRLEKEGASEADRDPALQHSAWRDGAGHLHQIELLHRAVERSGGRVALVERPDRIEPRFREVLQELRDQYVLGYYPSRDRNDGRWHEVEVKVRRRGIRVRTAGGYVDD